MEHKYRLIVFLNKKVRKETDIVPFTWLAIDGDKVFCKFMPGPYSKEKIKKLTSMVKKCDLPEESWPEYHVDIRGRAITYEEAEDKIIILEKQSYAYSTDNEKSAKEKSRDDKKVLKFKSVSTKTPLKAQFNQALIDLAASDSVPKKHAKKPKLTKQDFRHALNPSSSRDIQPTSSRNSNCNDLKKNDCSDTSNEEIQITGKRTHRTKKKRYLEQFSSNNESEDERKSSETDVPRLEESYRQIETDELSLNSEDIPSLKELTSKQSLILDDKNNNSELNVTDEACASYSRCKSIPAQEYDRSIRAKENEDTGETISKQNKDIRETVSKQNEDIRRTASKQNKDIRETVSKQNINKKPSTTVDTDEMLLNSILHKHMDDTNNDDDLYNLIGITYRSLAEKIAQLSGEVVALKLTVDGLTQKIVDLQLGEGEIHDGEDLQLDTRDQNSDIHLPCKTYEEFEHFDKKLATDLSYNRIIARKLLRSINQRSSLTRNIGDILRTFLSQDLAMKFTTLKAVPKKHVFKDTALYTCIENVMIKCFSNDDTPMSTKCFQEAVKAIFNNAKDWNGQRTARQKPKQTAVEQNKSSSKA